MKNLTTCFLLLLLTFPFSVRANTGEKLYTEKLCQICHGTTGKEKIQGMPRLWGQQKQYLTNQMNDILSGKRDNNYSQLMRLNYTSGKPKPGSLEKILTPADIKALVDYLNSLK